MLPDSKQGHVPTPAHLLSAVSRSESKMCFLPWKQSGQKRLNLVAFPQRGSE